MKGTIRYILWRSYGIGTPVVRGASAKQGGQVSDPSLWLCEWYVVRLFLFHESYLRPRSFYFFSREVCWTAKDAYWACLSTHGTEEPCAALRQDFETHCKKAWVKHFDRQREFQKFKAEAEKKRLEQSGATWISWKLGTGRAKKSLMTRITSKNAGNSRLNTGHHPRRLPATLTLHHHSLSETRRLCRYSATTDLHETSLLFFGIWIALMHFSYMLTRRALGLDNAMG